MYVWEGLEEPWKTLWVVKTAHVQGSFESLGVGSIKVLPTPSL